MDFSARLRGGRAVLDLSQAEFAEACGVGIPSLSAIEAGGNSTEKTRQKIVRAFENRQLFFTPKGLELEDGPVVILSDPSPERCYLRLLDDVAAVLKHRVRPELLISYADDKVSPPAVVERYRAMRKMGVQMRQLISDDNTYIMGELSEYRCIPAGRFINRVTVIYGDNVAFVTAEESTITIFRDSVNANRERNTFDLLWTNLSQPERSTADERF